MLFEVRHYNMHRLPCDLANVHYPDIPRVPPAKKCEGASDDSRLNRDGKACSSAMTAIAGVSQHRDFKLEILRILQTRKQMYVVPSRSGSWQGLARLTPRNRDRPGEMLIDSFDQAFGRGWLSLCDRFLGKLLSGQ